MEVKNYYPKIRARSIDPNLEASAKQQGLHPLLARIIAARAKPDDLEIADVLTPKLSHLTNPVHMQDFSKAAERIGTAIIQQQCIGLETDHDCDGQTSHAVLMHNLVYHFNHPQEKIRSYIGNRLTEGYGLSEPVMQKILNDEQRPNLVITADNGSADEPQIAVLKQNNIDVIVTDHHQIPITGYPISAYAFVNPTREDCDYPDSYIAGCMVAWLLMSGVRNYLIEQNYLPNNAPKLNDSLDYVAVGTVADCVSMARSSNNRAVVAYGMKLIEQGNKPCWQALLPELDLPLTSDALGFKIGPLLNSDGRLSDAFGSVSFLLAENIEQARRWIDELNLQNQERKSIQKKITNQGLAIAKQQVLQNKLSLCIYIEDGHSGVHGISASRVKDLFGRPTIFLSPKQTEQGILTGSLRGIDGFDIHQALNYIHHQQPDLMLSFGGHQGAGGVKFYLKNLPQFEILFEEAASQQLNQQQIGPVILSDGEIKREWISLEILKLLKNLEPYGREFEQPVFNMDATIKHLKLIGDHTHARVTITDHQGYDYNGVWFNLRSSQEQPMPVTTGQEVTCAFSLQKNQYMGNIKAELIFISMVPR